MATSKQNLEKNYGDEKDNYAQDDTHCPQDGAEGGARYSQDGTEGGAHYSQDGTEGGARCPQDGTEGGTRCPQDGAKANIANCIADYKAGSPPPPRYIKRTDRNNDGCAPLLPGDAE
jgi:hypothetical protein